MKFSAKLLLIFLAAFASPSVSAQEKSYTLKNNLWSVRVVPVTLGVWGKPAGVRQELLLASPARARKDREPEG